MKVPEFSQWRRITLDTTVLINLINGQRPGCTDPVALFVNKLIRNLSERKSTASNPDLTVNFAVSALSICEILQKNDKDGRIRRIVGAIQSSNVEFIDFDTYVADFMVKEYHAYLGNKALNSTATKLGWLSHDLVNAREWIYKDLMILASAGASQSDLILTNDVKTLYPVAKDLNFPCALAFPECFEESGGGKYILRYDEEEAERQYEARKPKTQFRAPINN